ncbi:MAG: aminotransferase class III-fold pyridoxal phosphate-dependent enzyme [Candidatus Hydrogenedens sp.]|nr:aminotransferase class III-fold pyridoxal phosphate-dependent enzyme [Candidatus Hydrogenedens sp.]
MASKEFPLEPVTVPLVDTPNRKIRTAIPAPESVDTLRRMRACEPRSMGGQPPVLWDRAEGVHVHDAWGNQWLDFSSGVLVANSGHGRREIVEAINEAAGRLYHAYCFPTALRLELEEAIAAFAPAPLNKVFLLTTGSEATEACLKLARTRGMALGGPEKSVFVTFTHAFHGRTMGAQLAGGIPGLKGWLGDCCPRFVNVPFPDGFRQTDVSFAVFEESLRAQGVDPARVCGVMTETFQGCNATLLPQAYAKALRDWCDTHGSLLIFDEVQAGFGRTGRAFGFEHLGVVPDLAACGKGISGGMPLSAVLGPEALMNLYGPGEMTSTHSANPVCAAAALANLRLIRSEGLMENAAALDPVLREGSARIAQASGGRIARHDSVGLVASLQWTEPGTTTPDPERAWEMINRSVQRGVMLFAPVGVGGGAVKICPPLVIDEAALREGLEVLETIAAELA